MMIDKQDTLPLPVLPRMSRYSEETSEERYKRLKAFSDTTGVRLLFVYLVDEELRRKANGEKLQSPHNHIYPNRGR